MTPWRPVDELIERDQERFNPHQMFLDALKEAQQKEEEVVRPAAIAVKTDLPKRNGRKRKVVLGAEYKRAIHSMLAEGRSVAEISRKFKVTKVAVRLHRDEECTCRMRALVG